MAEYTKGRSKSSSLHFTSVKLKLAWLAILEKMRRRLNVCLFETRVDFSRKRWHPMKIQWEKQEDFETSKGSGDEKKQQVGINEVKPQTVEHISKFGPSLSDSATTLLKGKQPIAKLFYERCPTSSFKLHLQSTFPGILRSQLIMSMFFRSRTGSKTLAKLKELNKCQGTCYS